MILAGDIGGTNTRIALFDQTSLHKPVAVEVYASQEEASLESILDHFLQKHAQAVELACFGVAGPVHDNRSTATNLPWMIDGAALATRLATQQVWVINDLAASAYGVAMVAAEGMSVLNAGAPDAVGNAAIIAAGTGLGEAGLFWDGRQHHPFASEGGHASFSPTNELEVELLRWLQGQWTHVSWERVLSGPGLANIYRFFKDTGRGEEPAWLRDEMQQGNAAAVISEAALAQRSELCVAVLDCFCRLYGSEASNLAMKLMATGGVYVAGGIAVKNFAKLRDGGFLEAFLGKGRMLPLLEAMPVRIILNEQLNLLGAARCALLRAGSAE